jgi:uncharacterized protein (DUF302 family)
MVEGMIVMASWPAPAEALDRLSAIVTEKGMTIFARIDHAAGARAVQMDLRPTALLIFGNAKAGTPVMQAAQTAGIDLPLKVLAWCDADGKNWLGYIDPLWIGARHGADAKPALAKMAEVLATMVRQAAQAS